MYSISIFHLLLSTVASDPFFYRLDITEGSSYYQINKINIIFLIIYFRAITRAIKGKKRIILIIFFIKLIFSFKKILKIVKIYFVIK